MPDIPLQFRWNVAEGGYRWVDSRPGFKPNQPRQPFLTDGRPVGTGGWRVMPYLPLAAFPGLFRVFADTKPSREGVKAFADRFGPLGPDITKHIPLQDQLKARAVPLGTGEALADWAR